MRRIIFFILFFISYSFSAQVAINNDGSGPDTSAMLDVKSTDKGMLIPRMTASERDNISNPATGLTVYVTDDNSFYYFDGTSWIRLQTDSDGKEWLLTGNAGTTPGTHFLGTTDANDLVFKTNNNEQMRILSGGNVGIGISSPAEKLHINGSVRGNQSGALRISTGNGYVDIGPKNGSWSHFYTDRNRYYFNRGITVDQGLIGSYNEDLQLQTQGTTRMTILNSNGHVGIATTTPPYPLTVTDDDDDYVGYFVSTEPSTDNIAVYGVVNNTDNYGIGGRFVGGFMGLQALVSPTGSGTYYSIYAQTNGGSGTNFGTYSYTSGSGSNFSSYNITSTPSDKGSAGFFVNTDNNGTGIFSLGSNVNTYYYIADGAAISATGTIYSIMGFSEEDNSSTVCVYGAYEGTNNYADATGVQGYSVPTDNWGYGVKGYGGYRGVYGVAINGDAGVYGYSDGSSYGVYSNGDMGASGTKSFVIDHPLDPENKFLKHFSIESNEVLNVYRGNVILDTNGEATVQLPDYFHAINSNFSYTLTPVGQPAPGLYIAQEIDNQGTFKIAGGNPGQKISWYIYAERNDPYLQHYPEKRQVEVLKNQKERGKYLRPELYGKPQSMSMEPEFKKPETKKLKVQKDPPQLRKNK